MLQPNEIIVVRRQWNDYRTAEVEFSKIDGWRWDYFSGGVRMRSPYPMIYGYASCEDIEGDFAHSGIHGECPHRIKVCVTKKDNGLKVFRELEKLAGQKPGTSKGS